MKGTILSLILIMLSLSLVSAAITGSETMTRTAPSTVNPSSTFQITYTAIGTSGSWGASIQDAVTGGCTFPSGSNSYKTVMLSEDGNTKTITMTAPSSGSCVFSGDYKYGIESVKNLPSTTVSIGTTGCPSGQVKCSDGTCKTSCGTEEKTDWTMYIIIGVAALVFLVMLKRK